MLTSMELDDEEKIDQYSFSCCPAPEKKPDFPWGLRITLTEKELDKLGLGLEDAEVGGIFHGHFLARVTDIHQALVDGKESCRVEAQIEYLAIESEDEEDE